MSRNNHHLHRTLQNTGAHDQNNRISPFHASFNRMNDRFSTMMQQMDDSFHEFGFEFDHNSRLQTQTTNDNFRITIDVSDFDSNEVRTDILNREVIVKAEHCEQTRNSQSTRQFQTKFLLPNYVNPDQVRVNLSQGMLVIEAPISPSIANNNNHEAIGSSGN